MIPIATLNHQQVQIERFETTFILLRFAEQSQRFNFFEKKEAFLKICESGRLNYFTNHPLLLNHNEESLELFIASKPKNVEVLADEVKIAINNKLNGWRTWDDYLNDGKETFETNLHNGYGKLLSAPFSVIDELQRVFERHQVHFTLFGKRRIYENELIVINNQFVIAEKFIPQ